MLSFHEPIFFGRFIKRYQRFFMDVLQEDGQTITAYTPNTGSMLGLLEPGSLVMMTKSADAQRKHPYTAHAIESEGAMVGINTHAPNQLIRSSLSHPLLCELADYAVIKPEVAYGEQLRSRIDFFCSASKTNAPSLYLEIKNVTMKHGEHAQFPDAVSTRALKHVDDLIKMSTQGFKAKMWFIVQRQDCSGFAPAESIDPIYAQRLKDAVQQGVNIRALAARIDTSGLRLTHELPCIV